MPYYSARAEYCGARPIIFGPLRSVLAMATQQQDLISFSMVPSGATTPVNAGPQQPDHQVVPDGKRPRSDQAAASGRPPLSLAETSTAVLELQPLRRFSGTAIL